MELVEDEEERLIANGGAGIPIGPVCVAPIGCCFSAQNRISQDGVPRPLLPPLSPKHAGRKCLVLDLDETLVHSSFKVRVLFIPLLSLSHVTRPSRYNRQTTSYPLRLSITGIMCM